MEPVHKEKNLLLEEQILTFIPIALRTLKTLWSFGRYECNRLKAYPFY